MKILFLDIDGVLNHEDFYERREVDLKNGVSYPHYNIDPHSMSLLNEFLGDYDVKIVITSTWRADGLDVIQDTFDKYGDNFDIIGLTPFIDDPASQRGNEILSWIIENQFLVGEHHLNYSDYVILDDDNDMLYKQKDNFIHVDNRYGLDSPVIKRMKEILNLK